jgi:hypothetical protein
MSIRVMNAVWQNAPYSEGTLLVLLALADWADDDGLCYPKRSQIAVKARLTESGVKFCLRQLIADGAISVDQESAGPGRPRVLKIGGQYLTPKAVTPLTPMGSPHRPKGGQSTIQKGVSNHTRNKEEPSLNHQEQNHQRLEPICKTHPDSGLTIWGTCWDCYSIRAHQAGVGA